MKGEGKKFLVLNYFCTCSEFLSLQECEEKYTK